MKKDKKIIDQKDIKKGITTITKKSKGFLGEFKQFIAKGNVMDLAVGVIIGNAFSKIVKSLTEDILMPLIGALIGGVDFSKAALPLKMWDKVVDLKYGLFVQSVVDFLITAFCIFIMIKIINSIFRKKEAEKKEETPEPPKKTNEEVLLEEIRDLLKEKSGK